MRAWRTRVADERGVEADVILTNHVLMALARANPDDLAALQATDLLGDWKFDAYGPGILKAMA